MPYFFASVRLLLPCENEKEQGTQTKFRFRVSTWVSTLALCECELARFSVCGRLSGGDPRPAEWEGTAHIHPAAHCPPHPYLFQDLPPTDSQLQPVLKIGARERRLSRWTTMLESR